MKISNDRSLLDWVVKKYPPMFSLIIGKTKEFNGWRFGLPKYVSSESIYALSLLVGFTNITSLSELSNYNKKKYNKTIMKLRKHIRDNPDMVTFVLL